MLPEPGSDPAPGAQQLVKLFPTPLIPQLSPMLEKRMEFATTPLFHVSIPAPVGAVLLTTVQFSIVPADQTLIPPP